jgi:hypothetical protein
MRRVLTIAGVVIGVATLSLDAQQQFQVFARIVDGTGAPVASLEPTDVRVLEDDKEAKILKIEPINWPIKVQILLDNGAGLGSENLTHLRNGARGLIEALPEGTEVTLVTTAPQPRQVVRATTDRAAQLKGIDLLTPDGGTGRFVESLDEAMQRVERDKTEYFPVIISLGTLAGDTGSNLENVYKQLMRRLQQRPATVHVVMFSKGTGGSSGGAVQTEVGQQVTQAMRGRYEAIAAATRLATLLPELGAQVAKSHANQSKQFRITVTRNGSGNLGKISLSTRSGLSATALSMDGHVP